MIMAQEQAILKAQEQFAQIQDFLRQACGAGRPIDQIESDLWGRVLQLGRQLLEGYVAGYRQGTWDRPWNRMGGSCAGWSSRMSGGMCRSLGHWRSRGTCMARGKRRSMR